jgi:WD40 repeat protein
MWDCDFPLVCHNCTASSLNSFVYVGLAFCMVLSFSGNTFSSQFTPSILQGQDHLPDADSRDRKVQILDADSAEILLAYDHEAPVTALAWSPDGRSIASGSQDQTVQVREASTGVLQLIYRGHEAPVSSIAWSPDGRRIISQDGQGAQVWDVARGVLLHTFHKKAAAGDSMKRDSAGWLQGCG